MNTWQITYRTKESEEIVVFTKANDMATAIRRWENDYGVHLHNLVYLEVKQADASST
jgi:hypothetical protein